MTVRATSESSSAALMSEQVASISEEVILPRERKEANAPVSLVDSESNIGAHTTPALQIISAQLLLLVAP